MMLHRHPGGLALTQRLLSYCGFASGAKVLDIGCGTGTTVEYLMELGMAVTGVDVSEMRLNEGKKRVPGINLLQARGEALPLEDKMLDGVIAECSLSVMEQVEAVIDEINRVLADEGILAVTDVYAQNEQADMPGYKTSEDWKRLLVNHGFSIRCWEDQSALLPAFVASMIMECGLDTLDAEMVKQAKPGYFLLVAEKSHKEG